MGIPQKKMVFTTQLDEVSSLKSQVATLKSKVPPTQPPLFPKDQTKLQDLGEAGQLFGLLMAGGAATYGGIGAAVYGGAYAGCKLGLIGKDPDGTCHAFN